MALLSPRTVFAPGIKPRKAEIIQLLDALRDSGADIVAKGTKADLLLVTPDVEGDLSPVGYVFDDPVEANNGIYAWTGSTWSRERGFPDTLAALTSVGGTANAITASARTGVDPAEVVALIVQPLYTNSGSVTLSVDGAAAKPLLDFQGIALAPGAIVAGQLLILVDNGDEYRLLLPALAVATFDHKGDYDDGTAYSEGQAVTGSDGAWYQLKIASSTGEDPVGSLTGNWLKILAEGTFPAGSVTAEKISDDPFEWAVIAEKLRILSKSDVSLYVDPVNGVDDHGRGSVALPFRTPQGALDLGVPYFVRHRYIINLADGEYAESYRPALSMQRPALIHCDQKHMGLRTDGPGGVMTGPVVFRGASKAGVILKPDATYPRGIYVTAFIGCVAFQNITIKGQAGSEIGLVAHRGSYVHASDFEIDGQDLMTYGCVAEAGGIAELLNFDVHHVTVGGQTFGKALLQFALASNIHDVSLTGLASVKFSEVSIAVGAQLNGPLLVQDGGWFESAGVSGQRCVVSGPVTMRNGDMTLIFTDFTGAVTQYGGDVYAGAFGWSKQWTVYGGRRHWPGAKSYVAPAPQSDVAVPLIFLGDVYDPPDPTVELRNNAGNVVAPNIGAGGATIAADGAVIPVTLRSRIQVMAVGAAAPRLNVTIANVQTGAFAGTPIPDGQMLVLMGTGSSVQIVPGTTAIIDGGSVTLGTATGFRGAITCVWSASRSRWLVLSRGDTNP